MDAIATMDKTNVIYGLNVGMELMKQIERIEWMVSNVYLFEV